LGRLVHADRRHRLVGGQGVDVQGHLHLGDEPGRVPLRDAPRLGLQPGLGPVFFSARRTVSMPTPVTSPRAFSAPANSVGVPRARPSGGGPQWMAIRWASTRPSIFGGTGGAARALRPQAALGPPAAKLWRTRATVLTCMPGAAAIQASDRQ